VGAQVARALVLPFTVVLSRTFLGTAFSVPVLAACAVVFVGFVVGLQGELHPSAPGVLLGVASSVTTALHAIIIKRSLAAVDGRTLDLAYYNNVLSAVLLLPAVVVVGETRLLLDTALLRISPTFLWGTLLAVRDPTVGDGGRLCADGGRRVCWRSGDGWGSACGGRVR
jgi:drug/metabolite transporter (DMT)-like permease